MKLIKLNFIRAEKILLLLFLLSLPFQTRLIIKKWTLPFNEWTSSFLYISDLLLLGVFLLWFFDFIKKPEPRQPDKAEIFFAVFLLISIFSLTQSRLIGLSLYGLLKLFEFFLLFLYFKTRAFKIIRLEEAAFFIFISGIFQSLVGIFQYLFKSSLGLKILGESPLSVNTYNVATFSVNSREYLRAYGTLPHPNVLAAWLFFSLACFYFIYLRRIERWPIKTLVGIFSGYLTILLGLILTFSRIAGAFWVLYMFCLSLFLLFRNRQYFPRWKKIIWFNLFGLAVFSILLYPQIKSRAFISSDEEAVSQRLYYGEIASQITKNRPWLGVGIGQFVSELIYQKPHFPQRFYQPVHNVYLLISSEVGLPGLLAFLLFLFWVLRSFHLIRVHDNEPTFVFQFLFPAFLLMAIFDHFFWTLQQGSLIFWMLLGIL